MTQRRDFITTTSIKIKGTVAFSADQRAKQKEKDYISRSLSKPRLPMKYSLCLLMESKNNFALLSVFLPTRGIYIQLRGRLKKDRRNVPERLVFPHIAALFGTLTSVWFRQRSTTPHEKTNLSGAKQFLGSKFLSRQGKKVSNADALRNFLTQYRRKFALKNHIEPDYLQP